MAPGPARGLPGLLLVLGISPAQSNFIHTVHRFYKLALGPRHLLSKSSCRIISSAPIYTGEKLKVEVIPVQNYEIK